MQTDLKQNLKSIRIVHLGLMLGVFFFLIVTLYLNQTAGAFITNDPTFTNYLLLAANIFSIPAILAGQMIFRKRMNSLGASELNEKIVRYREATIVRAATIEGPCFFFIVGFMLTGNIAFFIEAIAGLFLMGLFYPFNNRIANELKIDVRKLY